MFPGSRSKAVGRDWRKGHDEARGLGVREKTNMCTYLQAMKHSHAQGVWNVSVKGGTFCLK